MKYCVLSTDNNPDYYSLLPLVCYSWRKIGYWPIVYAINVPEHIQFLLMEYCQGHIFGNPPIKDVKDSTFAQLKRLFVNGCEDSDVLITADADMVIAKDIFTHDVGRGQIVSYGYDLTGKSEIPICYVRATKGKWHELMGDTHIPDSAYSEQWERYWSADQQLLTLRAKQYGMDRITFVDRGNNGPGGLPTGRWDRHGWVKPAEIIDVHMKRNDWNAQIEVFQALWPGEDYSFLLKFKEALNGL